MIRAHKAPTTGHNSGDTVAVGQLRAFVERVERLEEEIKGLNGDKSDIYKEAKQAGFDVTAVRAVVAKRRLDTAKREERDAIFDLYWESLHGTGTEAATRVHLHEAKKAAEEITPSGGGPKTANVTALAARDADESAAPIAPSKPLRPHCLRPDECGGVGFKHCHQCQTKFDAASKAEDFLPVEAAQ